MNEVSDPVLLVEDDAALGAQIVETLRGAGLDPTWIRDGDEAGRTDIGAFRLVLLDLMLPGTYGMDLLKRWRAKSDVPVIVLTARHDTHDKVRALGLGADDYVTKPFWPEELVARVRARLRRPTIQRSDALEVGTLHLDLAARTATLGGVALELTRVELDLLAALARRAGSAVTRKALVEAALDPDKQGGERTLDVHVSRLRKKLAGSTPAPGPEIATVWGIGYKLVP